jgi:4-diphosphocytidyl-2-C-methyl-D-erythritol kinase
MNKEITKSILAPAKINLRLEVLSRRQDGYHEIKSIICPIKLYDIVSIFISNQEIRLTSDNNNIPLDGNNLAYQAATLLIQKAKISRGVHIHLKKSIPVASGLGGGSSDAAAVMKGINELYRLNYTQSELMKLGSEIGADVPFFLFQGPALATGIGEKLTPIRISPSFWTLLITPSKPVSTAWAYSQFKGKPRERSFDITEKIDLVETGNDILHNDLESVVTKCLPEIDEIKKVLRKLGAWGSLMSGSGPTVFGIFLDESEAKRAEKELLKDHRGQEWKISVAEALV